MEENINQIQQASGQSPVPVAVEPKPARNWLKISLVVILLLVLGAGLVFAGTKIGEKRSSPVPTATPTISEPTPTIDPTAGWKTYSGSGIEFRYPSTWVAKDNLITATSPKIDIYIVSRDSTLLNECMQLVSTETRGSLILKKFTRVTTGEMCATSDSTPREIWVTPSAEAFSPGISYKYSSSNNQQAELIFDQILSTFKFLPTGELTLAPTINKSLRQVYYRNISGWPRYQSLLDFEFQYPPDYELPQKNVVDFMGKNEFYCSFSTTKKVGTGLDSLNFIVIPKNYEDNIERVLKILNAPGYLKKEEVEIYAHPAILLDLDQSYGHYSKSKAVILEVNSTLLIGFFQQNEINQSWNYILESLKIGQNFSKEYFQAKVNECRSF